MEKKENPGVAEGSGMRTETEGYPGASAVAAGVALAVGKVFSGVLIRG